MSVRIPVAAVLAIYARETGQGMIFTDEDAPPPQGGPPDQPSSPDAGATGTRPRLTVVK